MPSTREWVQPAPKEYAVPRATIRATSEAQIEFIEALDDAEYCTLECKQIEDRTDCALDLLIWIEDDLVVLENKSDRQGEAQFVGIEAAARLHADRSTIPGRMARSNA